MPFFSYYVELILYQVYSIKFILNEAFVFI